MVLLLVRTARDEYHDKIIEKIYGIVESVEQGETLKTFIKSNNYSRHNLEIMNIENVSIPDLVEKTRSVILKDLNRQQARLATFEKTNKEREESDMKDILEAISMLQRRLINVESEKLL